LTGSNQVDADNFMAELVPAAYGWPSSLTDLEFLEPSLALNDERAAWQGQQRVKQLAHSPPPVAALVERRVD
jgi:hypothetical protein